MVKSKSRASSNYERGINRVGISAWQEAARTSTPKAAAEILESAKAESLSVSDFVSAYEAAYE